MSSGLRLLTIFALLFAFGCVSDDDRCDEGQEYKNGGCVPIEADAGESDQGDPDMTPDDLGPQPDGDEVDAPALPTGMGETCSDQDDCASYEADYCLIQPPSTEGACTVQDCNATENDCPTGYTCCDFSINSVPDFCAPDADYATLKSMNMCA